MEHSLTYALIQIGDVNVTTAGLASGNPVVRRILLTALDQMDDSRLDAPKVTAELTSDDPKLRETAWWIAGRHPEWAPALTNFFHDRLSAADRLSPSAQEALIQHLSRFAANKAIQQLLVGPYTGQNAQRIALRVMAQANLKEAPLVWIIRLAVVLNSDNADLQNQAIAAARHLRIPPKQAGSVTAALLKIGSNSKATAPMRVSALAAVPGGLTKMDPALFDFLRSHLDAEQPVAVRTAAAEVLAKAKLDAEQLLALAETLKSVGPMEMDRMLDAFVSTTEENVGLALVSALKATSARSSLRVETLKPRLAKYGPVVQRQAEELYAALDVDAAKQRAQLEQLLSSLKDGDVRRGQAVFNSSKASCSACHAIGYLGGKVGPDLTQIGKIRTERDLLESIVFPSASLVRSYEPVQVTTKNGKVHNGLILKDGPEEIVLATGPNQEARLSRDDIEEVQPSKVSVMPAGLDQQLTVRELADLVAFLKACK